MFSSIHEKVVHDHFQKLSLEEILSTGFKSVFSGKNLPDTPFPILYRTVNFYKTIADIEKAKEQLKDHFSANELQQERFFGISNLPSTEGIYGIKQLLELINPQNIIMLRKRAAQCMIEVGN